MLRQTLESTGKVALAKVVLHTQQHLALLRPPEDALVMITLRWPEQVRGLKGLELDKRVSAATVDKQELQMAKRLVEAMAGHWAPEAYRNDFKHTIMALVEKKASQGKVATVEAPGKGADIIDLTELLKRSLGGNKAPRKKA